MGDSKGVWNHFENKGAQGVFLSERKGGTRPGKPTPHPQLPKPGQAARPGSPLKLGRHGRSVRDPKPPLPPLPALTRSRYSLPSPRPKIELQFARPHLPRADKRTLPSRAPPPNSGSRLGPSPGRGHPENSALGPDRPPPQSSVTPRAPPPRAPQSFVKWPA